MCYLCVFTDHIWTTCCLQPQHTLSLSDKHESHQLELAEVYGLTFVIITFNLDTVFGKSETLCLQYSWKSMQEMLKKHIITFTSTSLVALQLIAFLTLNIFSDTLDNFVLISVLMCPAILFATILLYLVRLQVSLQLRSGKSRFYKNK